MPSSAITLTAKGLTIFSGLVPPEKISASPEVKNERKKPSAIWLRQELPVQRMSIRICDKLIIARL
jgi:hypothetical protein